jgi:filamentous hemagglutinin
VVLTGIEYSLGMSKVYNMRIEEYHTFFVGSPTWGFSVWTHNLPGDLDDCSPASSMESGATDAIAPNNANNAASYARYKQSLAAEEAAGNPGVTRNGQFADTSKLEDHANRHGSDFGASTAAEYEQQANTFTNGPLGHGVLEKTRPNGDIIRYNDVTGEFGIAQPDGTIRTYYLPRTPLNNNLNPPGTKTHKYPTNLDYYNAQ